MVVRAGIFIIASNGINVKRVCPTRRPSRVDAVRAVKIRYVDILKVLTKICLESQNKAERDDTIGLRKLESLNSLYSLLFGKEKIALTN